MHLTQLIQSHVCISTCWINNINLWDEVDGLLLMVWRWKQKYKLKVALFTVDAAPLKVYFCALSDDVWSGWKPAAVWKRIIWIDWIISDVSLQNGKVSGGNRQPSHGDTPPADDRPPPNPTRADFWVPIKVGHNKPRRTQRSQRKRGFLFPQGEAKVVRLGQKKADKPGRPEFWSLGVVSSVGPHVRETQKLSDRSLLTRFKAFISMLSIDWFSRICDSHVDREQRRQAAAYRSVLPGSQFAAFWDRLKQLTYALNTRMLLLASAKYQFHHQYCSFSLTTWVFAWILLAQNVNKNELTWVQPRLK